MTTYVDDVAATPPATAEAPRDAIISKDLDGKITSWSVEAERLYGYLPAEVLGRHRSVLAHEDFRSSEAAVLLRVAAGGRVEMFRTRRIHKTGAFLDVSLSLAPILDDAGVVIGVTSASRDVGELTLAQTRSQGLLEAVPDAVVCVDAEGLITFVNDQMGQLFGYTGSELIGEPVEILIPPPTGSINPGLLTGDTDKPKSRPLVGGAHKSARRKDGTTFAAEIRLDSVDIGGGLIITAAIRDVTDHIAVQTALQESEARARELAHPSAVAFVLRGLDPPAFLYVSPGYARIFGYDPMTEPYDGPVDEEDPSGSMRCVHPDDLERFRVDYWDQCQAGLSVLAEYRIIRTDGEVRWVRAACAPVMEADGIVRRSAATVEDITDRKLAEGIVLSAHAEADKANSAKNEFLSRMSHELRTPLNAVLGFAQLLELDDLSVDQQDSVQHILRGGRQLLGLIDDVLDIAKIESDRLDMSLEPVLMSELLTDTVQMMIPTASAANIKLSYQAGTASRQFVQGDQRRLRQVILNLLTNAIKYNRPGGRIDVYCELPGNADLDIVFKDTGRGIRPDDVSQLFIPFDRLGAEASGIEGTGVGLALSQRLMSMMGGGLRATSELGVGSTFTASIPLAASPLTPRPVPEPAVATIAERHHVPTPGVATSTLVYIQDNGSNVELMERLIARRDKWCMVVAAHATLALEVTAAAGADLVLLDLHLPELASLEVLQMLRADPRTSHVRVVVVIDNHSPSRLLAAGAFGYLNEPLTVAMVLELLDSRARDSADDPG